MQTNHAEVLDFDAQAGNPIPIPGQIAPTDRVVGIAYDFNTDFIALRLEPSPRIRLFKRGENRFVREWSLPAEACVLPGASADIAFRPGDRHLFVAISGTSSILEYSVEGELLGRLAIDPVPGSPIGGLAYDHVKKRLLAVLSAGMPSAATHASKYLVSPSIIAIDNHGKWTPLCTLPTGLLPHALGANADVEELYLLQADGAIAVVDFKGRLLRTISGHMPPAEQPAQMDAGPRSFVRIF